MSTTQKEVVTILGTYMECTPLSTVTLLVLGSFFYCPA